MGAKQILCKADQSTAAKLEQFKAAKQAAGVVVDEEKETKEDAELRQSLQGILSGEAPAAANSAAPPSQIAPVELAGAEPHVKSEIERFREQELVRQQEMEVRRRERLQERVESSKRKEREQQAREMERKVEDELAKLKDAASSKSGQKPEVRDERKDRERHDEHSRDRDRRDRDRRDRDRGDRDRGGRDDRGRDDRGGRDDRERKRRRQEDGEEGEVSEYRYDGPETSPRAASISAPPLPPAPAPPVEAPPAPIAPVATVKLGFGFGAIASKNKKKETKPAAKPAMKMFQVADEEDSKKSMKQLVPLDYTEDEMNAVKPVADRVAATVARINAEHQPAAAPDVKSLIQQIPKGKTELFAYPIDWSVVDSRGLVESKMKQWVVKKIVEYLGEEEETLIDFVVSKLKEHAQPDAILEELALVLEEDAEIFMTKMWRALIFETLR
jgi:RNA-binding protein 25